MFNEHLKTANKTVPLLFRMPLLLSLNWESVTFDFPSLYFCTFGSFHMNVMAGQYLFGKLLRAVNIANAVKLK